MDQIAEMDQIDGVLMQTDAAMIFNTPMAKKTRRAVKNLKKLEDDCEIEAAPKSPVASASTNMLCMTPRRSTRKSVRPPMDYDDIIDHNTMINKDKVKHINADTEVIDEHKWHAAEVGRNSCKRSRKSKRKGTKKPKISEEQYEQTEIATVAKKLSKIEDDAVKDTETDKATDATQQEWETAAENAPESKHETKIDNMPQPEEKTAVKAEHSAETSSRSRISHAAATKVIFCSADQALEKTLSLDEATNATQQGRETVPEDVPQSKDVTKIDNMPQPEDEAQPSKETSLKSRISHAAATKIICSSDQALGRTNSLEKLVAEVSNEDMDDLGLCPLDAKQDVDEEDLDMPSLIMLDDGEPENVLNRTFDADDNSTAQHCIQIMGNNRMQQIGSGIEDMAGSTQEATNVAIKLILTDENEEDVTIKFNEDMLSAKKSQANHIQPGVPRRSNSTSDIKNTAEKNVSFFGSIKVTAISDIDKPWVCLDQSHITQRRRRSKSLDTYASKIPKPKHYPAANPLTPSKKATRTKLPNFTAIHQRQFNKMENLVQHIERKAVRAKELTNSALKPPQIGNSSKNVSGKKCTTTSVLAADRSRSRAVKKIVLASQHITPVKPELEKYQRMLPVPRKIVEIPKSKPATTTSSNPELEKYGKMLPVPRKIAEIPKLNSTITTTRNPELEKYGKMLPVPRKIAEIPKFNSTITASRNPLSSNIAKTMISKDLELAANRAVSNMAKFNLSTLVAKDSGDTKKNKMQDRRQRHIDMFKGRTGKEKKGEFIRGVRSNRRFELQMQHRQQMNENT